MFIGLKLCHQIDWSWWWVLCPLWIGAAIVLFCVVVVFVVSLGVGLWSELRSWYR